MLVARKMFSAQVINDKLSGHWKMLQRDENECSNTGVFRCTFRGGGYRKACLHGF